MTPIDRLDRAPEAIDMLLPHWLYIISVLTHIVAAMAWVGGMLFVSLILVPGLRRLDDAVLQARLLSEVGRRFRTVGWAAIAVLVVTGTTNAWGRWGLDALLTGAFWVSQPGRLLLVKLLVVAAMLVQSAVHDFVLGPRLSARRRAGAETADLAGLRRRVSWLARLNLVLGLGVIVLAVLIVRG